MTMTNDNNVVILHRSKHFLVVDKPYDMVINSNDPKVTHSLQEKIRKLFPDLINPNLKHDFHFVHRLDYATSGVICIALNKQAAKAASTAFEFRKVRKYYLALVHGHICQNDLVICEPIGEDIREQDGNRKMCTSSSEFCQKPRESVTNLLVLEHGYRGDKPATKVLLYPKTGRRHQLRVHCDFINHTIIGDYTYSCRQDTEPYRTFLHSYRIILDNEVENLDVTTCDPFSSADSRNQWKPTNFVRSLDNSAFSDLLTLT